MVVEVLTMKKLVIYYSLTGNSKMLAELFKEKGYEVREVVRKKKLPKSFFFSVFTGGFLAGINHKDKLKDYNPDIKEYDEVVIISPIWNGRFSSPINTVLASTDFSNKKLSFLFASGSGEGEKALKRIKKEYPDAQVLFLKEPKKHQEELDKLNGLL